MPIQSSQLNYYVISILLHYTPRPEPHFMDSYLQSRNVIYVRFDEGELNKPILIPPKDIMQYFKLYEILDDAENDGEERRLYENCIPIGSIHIRDSSFRVDHYSNQIEENIALVSAFEMFQHDVSELWKVGVPHFQRENNSVEYLGVVEESVYPIFNADIGEELNSEWLYRGQLPLKRLWEILTPKA